MARKRKPIPHLYGKVIVALCVVNMIGMGWYGLRIESRTNKSPTATLAVAVGAIGFELLGSFVRTIANEKQVVSKSDTERSANEQDRLEEKADEPEAVGYGAGSDPGWSDDA